MCRRKKLKVGVTKEGEFKKKRKRRKDTCCYKYGPEAWIRKLCKYLRNRISRCIKKKLFGVPNPRWSDYEIVGVDLATLKNKFKRDNATLSRSKNDSKILKKKNTISLNKVSIKDLQLIEKSNVGKLLKKFNIRASKSKVLDNLVDDYKQGKLVLSRESKHSKFRDTKLTKDKLNNIIEQYENARNKKYSIDIEQLKNLDTVHLKKKLDLTGSMGELFEHMVEEYKTGKLSISKLTEDKMDTKKINKQQMEKMLELYKKKKKKFSLSAQSWLKPFQIDNEQTKNLDIAELKKKISLTGSKGILFDQMVDEYKAGKLSVSKLTGRKIDTKNMNKKELNKMLELYKKNKDLTLAQSGLRQFQSKLSKVKF